MRASLAVLAIVMVVLLGVSLALGRAGATSGPVGAAASPVRPEVSAATPVTASVGGTHLLAVSGHAGYYFNATGGPAYAPNGSRVGNLTYYASIAGANTTGISLNPDQDAIFNGTAPVSTLTVGTVAETLTINVMFSSIYAGANESVNLTYTVNVVQPYLVSAVIEDVSSADVLSFPVIVSLDGAPVGTVTVATLTPDSPYHLSFSYLTLGLSAGWHTFSISLASQHGLVEFSGGATTFSESIYIPGPAPDYTLWYVVGVVAFVGTIFILVTRVAARRRGASRK